jgi:crossover junction endodeoxyribonuclease RuvC
MIIFGIDPGTAITGFGVIEARNNTVSQVDWGVITTRADAPLSERLCTIFDGIEGYLTRYRPDRVAIEQAFYAKNVHTTLLLGHARGVLMLASRKAGAAIAEYSPREIKKAITGNGGAEKSQVEYMIRMILSLGNAVNKSDAFDALGVAVCDFYHAGTRSVARSAEVAREKRKAGS